VSGRTVSFCFDDGFRASADKIRKIFDARGLSACFSVLAAPDRADDPGMRVADVADWGYWRDARAAGHEVAPHGYAHERYDEMAIEAARASVLACLDRLERELPGFDGRRSLFHVPYLRAPAALVGWLGERTLGARVARGNDGLNAWGAIRPGQPVDCVTFGPDRVAERLAARLARFEDETGWLVLVLHGVDGEGWGPVAADDLARLLDETLAGGADVSPPDRVVAARA